MKHIYFWRSLPLRDRNQLPESPGLYAVVSLWNIRYIGMSINLKQRWQGSGHGRYEQASRQAFCRLHYIPLRQTSRDLKDSELILIHKYKPSWTNTALPKKKRLRRNQSNGNMLIPLIIAIALAALVLMG